MNAESCAILGNAESVPLREVPVLSTASFRRAVVEAIDRGGRVTAFFGVERHEQGLRALAVVAHDDRGDIAIYATDLGTSYEALTPDCPEVHWFERELAEQWGVVPRGHPWLKPVRLLSSGVTEYFRVEGEEIHEVAVGPVHAGVIEPGHFRFQCHGEEVLHLEISLGYQHRGIERALEGGPGRRTIHHIETAAGDTTVGHAHAYALIVGALAHVDPPPRAQAFQGIALELERIANHVGDLGALAGDVGFLPTASYGGRIRGDVLNLTALLCGNRFGRGLIRPDGTRFDLDETLAATLDQRMTAVARDAAVADRLLWETPSVMARFEGTGVVSRETCESLGLVGPAARACGADRDVRQDHPFGVYRFAHIPSCTWTTGDVFGRAHVRSIEIQRSFAFIREQLAALPAGPVRIQTPTALPPERIAVSLVEGWRGEICHVAVTGPDGRFARYKIVDPSFHNWAGLAWALRGEQISDFPLCNKSFNLSYCGHDL